mmetsp:Transcript_4368/g.10428  ORF Transcript_4368/g.10428 Transcript_4368/m.10428 type:complete len:80 (+) Transcript_4368:317-556(+)
MVVSSMVSDVWRRMMPLFPRRLVLEDENEVVLLAWVDAVDDREQCMMKMASRTKMDDEDEDLTAVGDLFGDRCAVGLVL